MSYKDSIKNHKLAKPILTKLAIGDWSGDGHKQSDDIIYHVNYPVRDIQNAYKESCKLTGVQFHHGKNYITPGGEFLYDQILTEYGESHITPEQTTILKKFHVITDEIMHELQLKEISDNEILIEEAKDLATIIMRFIVLSMPDDFIAAQQEKEDIPAINGYQGDLNVQFGYGIY